LRTNCIDCLDRTNVAQFAYGLYALSHQMHVLGITNRQENLYNMLDEWQKDSNGGGRNEEEMQTSNGNNTATSAAAGGSPVKELNPRSIVATELMDLYEAMGDCLALQYGGSEAHSKFFKRQKGSWEATTQSKDMMTSFRRFYSNTYTDAAKQAAMNLFLGNFVPNESHAMHIWDLESDDQDSTLARRVAAVGGRSEAEWKKAHRRRSGRKHGSASDASSLTHESGGGGTSGGDGAQGGAGASSASSRCHGAGGGGGCEEVNGNGGMCRNLRRSLHQLWTFQDSQCSEAQQQQQQQVRQHRAKFLSMDKLLASSQCLRVNGGFFDHCVADVVAHEEDDDDGDDEDRAAGGGSGNEEKRRQFMGAVDVAAWEGIFSRGEAGQRQEEGQKEGRLGSDGTTEDVWTGLFDAKSAANLDVQGRGGVFTASRRGDAHWRELMRSAPKDSVDPAKQIAGPPDYWQILVQAEKDTDYERFFDFSDWNIKV